MTEVRLPRGAFNALRGILSDVIEPPGHRDTRTHFVWMGIKFIPEEEKPESNLKYQVGVTLDEFISFKSHFGNGSQDVPTDRVYILGLIDVYIKEPEEKCKTCGGSGHIRRESVPGECGSWQYFKCPECKKEEPVPFGGWDKMKAFVTDDDGNKVDLGNPPTPKDNRCETIDTTKEPETSPTLEGLEQRLKALEADAGLVAVIKDAVRGWTLMLEAQDKRIAALEAKAKGK